ncbi:cyclophilin-like protein [Pseudovirgaria hyperparasitica]|uniref:Cyclophilin-like protein n=1 Tax=Pseudovirgaria hyperparasitica TaxID=470096 RepID=A0A6A6W033_9PEZI|nr:cyclophilin-like protein [Pseudovirgaria hyperparasitica]KAF2755903.1 cyclophilin-like protein [Pseudovirgaria hyperparasitica]
MASTYNVEPQPTAKVLLQTTTGDIELELFAKQIPKASRNFLQHCLDGYYDGTIFHRLVPNFVIQGGDPTGTGQGGESSFDGEPFEDEFHSRLKFNRRGLLGMANTGKDDNGSQFFITLAPTPELQKTNTMFGRVVGDTIYNVMKMGDADLVADSDRPLYPQKITGTEILLNPFSDMVKRVRVAQRTIEEKKEKKKPKRKAGKALLSFTGDEGEEDVAVPVPKKPKFNPKLVSGGGETPEKWNNTSIPKAPDVPKPAKTHEKPKTNSKAPLRSPTPPPDRARAVTQSTQPQSISSSRSPTPEPTRKSALERTNEQIAALKQSMKRNTNVVLGEPRKKSALEEFIPVTATRGRKRRQGGAAVEEKGALAILAAFKSKLDATPASAPSSVTADPEREPQQNGSANNNGNTADDDEAHLCDLHFIANCQSCSSWDKEDAKDDAEDDDANWMGHALTFDKDRLGKDLEWKRKNEEELVVIDPREKARELKEGKRGRDDRGNRGREKGSHRGGRDRR